MKWGIKQIHLNRISFFIFIILCSPNISYLQGQDNFWTPIAPPKCHYIIDARVDLEKGNIEGKETIILRNNSAGPIGVIAMDWPIGPSSSIDITAKGRTLTLLNSQNGSTISPPLFYQLSEPIASGKEAQFFVTFKIPFELSSENAEFRTSDWPPRLWWDGLPVHDSFSAKLDIPEGFAMAISGRLNKATGRYEAEAARTFGLYLGKNQKTESREVEGILITTLFTEKGAKCASVCLDTAVDAIKYYKNWLGFYPFKFLYIIPGGKGRWGGYPMATGIVSIHGQETFKEGESLLGWQGITAHEIGHEYWGEWVVDPDRPAWLWIGMGIFADTEYLLAREINPKRRAGWMSDYIDGISMYYDTTVDIPPARLEKINYGYNGTVIHSKGYSIVSALDSSLGRQTFERIYKKSLKEYGGKRLGWKDFQRFCEKESGQNLGWFFDQWLRSNKYLCYKIESRESKQEGDGYLSVIKVKRLGSMRMPVPVKAIFEDGKEQAKITDRNLDLNVLTFRSKAKLKEAILDPENKLAKLEEPLPEISAKAAEILSLGWKAEDSPLVFEKIKDEGIKRSIVWYRLGMDLYEGKNFSKAFECFKKVSSLHDTGLTKFAALGWMGLLKDLLGERQEALGYYKDALKYDSGEPMEHSWLGIRMDRKWVEERLKAPFVIMEKK